jgi:diguanylate cyclase (GGDEF)-like protein
MAVDLALEAQPPDLLGSRAKPVLRLAFAVLVLIVAAGTANMLVGFGGSAVDELIRTWGSLVVYALAAAIVAFRAIRVPRHRRPWIILAVGLTLYGLGNVVWTVWYDSLAAPPIPSIADGLWLALYPASYIGLVLLAREDNRAIRQGAWLDGIVAALGFGALGAAVVFGPVLASATGSPSAVYTNLAYPLADLLLAVLVVALLALSGWRLNRCWALLGAGFMLLYVADSIYLLNVASGASQSGLLSNLFYMSGVVVLALAAWQPEGKTLPAPVERWSVLLVPVASVATAIGLFIFDHFAPLNPLALVLATLTLLAAMVRTAIAFRDVRALAVARRQATTDDLTGLPNRRLFSQRTEEAIAAARAERGTLALLIVDLDEFKTLNDTLGHHAGDLLLTEVGPRVSAVLRERDMLARLGGDEFGVLLASPCSEAAALSIADRIGVALRQPFEIAGLHLRAAASVGIALFPAHSEDAQELLRHADVAMYQAKVARSGHELYASDRDTNSRDSFALASELPTAIASGQLELNFQPKAEAASGQIVGMEALVRWRHPQRGLLSPAEFIALAEQGGLMRDLTRAVMSGALSACHRWREAGYDVHVAVNVSFTDLLDAQFPLEVAGALAEHDVDPGALILEVTENSIMLDAERVGDVLARLGEFGVRISLDDFGTGYSSLTHLRTLPISEVKVDRSFVERMRTNATDDAIVSSTIQLAHSLGMRVVAEGVEDEATQERLAELGSDLIQGFHLSRPMPPDAAETFLDAHLARRSSLPRHHRWAGDPA